MAGRARIPYFARIALAVIRLVNGALALLAPATLARRTGVDPSRNGAALYALRLFGIRTVIIGAELLLLRDDQLRRALRQAIAIHLSDTLAAATAGRRGYLPRRSARTATAISAVNTGLSVVANVGDR
jgi:hypothetical protein